MTTNELKEMQVKVTNLRAEGKYKETIEESYKLLNIGKECKDPKSVLIAYINSAAAYYCIGDITEAFNSMDMYNDWCSKYGDNSDYVQLYNILFLLYEYINDYKRAKETLEKTISLGERLGHYNIVSNAYSNYSHVCIKEGDFKTALTMAKTGLHWAKRHQPASEILQLRVKLNIALAYIGLDELNTAEKWMKEISETSILNSNIREKSQFLMLQGKFFTKQNELMKAFNFYTEAKQLVESYQDLYFLRDIEEVRCDLCEQMNDIQLGYGVQKDYIALLKKISQLEFSYIALKLDVKYSLSALKEKTKYDFLTNLFNRQYIETKTNEWMQDTDSGENVVCIAFDFDNFKGINDRFGHLFGDEVLKRVSSACKDIMGKEELLGRYGGDEFVALIKGTPRLEGLEKAQQLKTVIESLKFEKDGVVFTLEASVGVAGNQDRNIHSFAELFELADQGLYQSKRKGKNRITIV